MASHVRQGVSNHRQLASLFNNLFRMINEYINTPYYSRSLGKAVGAGGIRSQGIRNMESVSYSWYGGISNPAESIPGPKKVRLIHAIILNPWLYV